MNTPLNHVTDLPLASLNAKRVHISLLIVFFVYSIFAVANIYSVASANDDTPASAPVSVTAPSSIVTTQLPLDNSQSWVYDFGMFDDGPLPTNDWNVESGVEVANYNDEAQAYTSRTDNVRIENGALVIEAKPEALHGKSYTSARIDSRDKFDFTYGTLEVSMKLPRGNGTWPAAWLMPVRGIYDPSDYGISPTDEHAWVVNGEIDFLESIGRIPNQNIPAAHTYNQRKLSAIYTPGFIQNPYDQFHTYGIIKSPTKIEFTIDGRTFASRTKTSDSPLDWPFDQPYYLILNLALGGEWAGADGIDDSTAPWKLEVKTISYSPLAS